MYKICFNSCKDKSRERTPYLAVIIIAYTIQTQLNVRVGVQIGAHIV